MVKTVQGMHTQIEAAPLQSPLDESSCKDEEAHVVKKDENLSTAHKDIRVEDALSTRKETSIDSKIKDAKSPVEKSEDESKMET